MSKTSLTVDIPSRGFPITEFEGRLNRAQRLMSQQDIQALFATAESLQKDVALTNFVHPELFLSPRDAGVYMYHQIA